MVKIAKRSSICAGVLVLAFAGSQSAFARGGPGGGAGMAGMGSGSGLDTAERAMNRERVTNAEPKKRQAGSMEQHRERVQQQSAEQVQSRELNRFQEQINRK